MPDSGDGHFVGAMPPQLFLDSFMCLARNLPPVPSADFSKVLLSDSIDTMCGSIIRTVDVAELCPDIQLYRARTTRMREQQDSLDHFYTPRYTEQGDEIEVPLAKIKHRACPAIAVRKRPQRKATQKQAATSNRARKPGSLLYYDYARNLLDIEVVHDVDADPFEDPPEAGPSSSRGGTSSPQLRAISPKSAQDKTPREATEHRLIHRYSHFCLRGVSLSPVTGAQPPSDAGSLSNSDEGSPRPKTPPVKERDPTPVSVSSSGSQYYTSFERTNVEATVFRTRLVAHARAEYTRQHRVFLFQVVLVHRFARLIRWDRSGAVVTERFDYVESPGILAEFLWRFNHMNSEERGFDPTVTLASSKERLRFETAVGTFLSDMKVDHINGQSARILPGAANSLDDSNSYPTWKVFVANPETGQETELIIRRPFSASSSLYGRATRAYVAYDLKTGRLLCLKDTWRKGNTGMRPESETYQILKRSDVPHIADVLYGGDVRGADQPPQETLTQKFAQEEDEWRITTSIAGKHVHHRLVQEIVYPLDNVTDEKEFLQVLHDVLGTIDKTYYAAGILHRDINYGNVMVTADGRGILNDWDHAGTKDNLARGIGTWAFMSVALLQDPEKLHDLFDDLESVFWVLVYGTVGKFLRPRSRFNTSILDEEGVDDKRRAVGGKGKFAALSSGLFAGAQFTCPTLQSLIQDCTASWLQCVIATTADRGVLMDGLRESLEKTLGLAKHPAFWQKKFAFALEQAKTCCKHHLHAAITKKDQYLVSRKEPVSSHMSREHFLSAHKPGDAPPADESCIEPQRSKRIKLS